MAIKARSFGGIAFLASILLLAAAIHADEVIFKNGDHLTGKIQTFDGSKLTLESPMAGTISIDMKNVRTFSSDGPIHVVLTDGSDIHQRVLAGPEGEISIGQGQAIAAQNIPLDRIKAVNPPPEHWSGNIVVGGLISRGNTNADSLNASAHLVRRGEKDRLTFDAGYIYARQHVIGQGTHETQNNWFVEGKYDYFFTPRFYGYGDARVERDLIADISLRLTPGAGVGYQWVDKPNLGFNTEVGASWLYRDYVHDGSNDSVAARAAYHLTAKLNDQVSVFHNFEYFPGLDRIDNYFFDTDAGIRASITKQMFTEFKIEYRYDARPAPGRGPNDLRYILGVGWNF